MPCYRAAGITTPRGSFHPVADVSFAKTCNGRIAVCAHISEAKNLVMNHCLFVRRVCQTAKFKSRIMV